METNETQKVCTVNETINKMKKNFQNGRNYLTPCRMAIIKKSTHKNAGEGLEKRETYCWWECKLIQPLWRTIGRFL